MPMHDWTRVYAGIYHAFHHSWIEEIARSLNRGLLPEDYYALAEQQAGGFGPDVLALRTRESHEDASGGIATKAQPKTSIRVESSAAFYKRKKSTIVVHHVSDDRIVAMIEIVSPGNKSSQKAFREFVDKACQLIEKGIHLIIIDPFRPGKRDPGGIHAAIWAEVEDEPFELPMNKPLTLVAYESDLTVRAYIEPIAVGDSLPDIPLFLEGNEFVDVPLETTYMAAWEAVPRRWRDVIEIPQP